MSSATTTPVRPRISGLPTPSRPSTGIPTPGRSRSSSRAGAPSLRIDADSERAFDALRRSTISRNRESDVSTISTSGSNPTLSPQSARYPQSGRRSVTSGGRPGSVASTSSALSSAPPRTPVSRPKTPITKPKAPVSVRPESRQSDIGLRTASRQGNRPFAVGDPVRIESLGFEGVLRFLGEIKGKTGTFAGVELGGLLAGMGKNDGSVNGENYFNCAPKCGVFVAVNKLSQPPQRPQSVSGRMTPAGQLSHPPPAFNTPSARPRTSKIAPSPTSQFSSGSRASKYANMTADRLRNATNTFNSPPPRSVSPVKPVSTRTSPTRTSPTRTPKATNRISAQDLGNLAVPIPNFEFTTPKPAGRPTISSQASVLSDISVNSPPFSPPTSVIDIPSESSSSPLVLTAIDHQEIGRLQAQLSALEKVKLQLMDDSDSLRKQHEITTNSLLDAEKRIAALAPLEVLLEETRSQLIQQEADLQDTKASNETYKTKLDQLSTTTAHAEKKLFEQSEESRQRIRDLEKQLDDSATSFASERRTLNSQVDELRTAGQETIALYEDRLSVAEDRRYELEELVSNLQEKLKLSARPLSPATMARHATEAAQIDNETLREQAAHLQKRISILEESLQDARAAAASEETNMRTRLEKHQEAETVMRKELDTWKMKLEDVRRSEGKARMRNEELEEALKENSTALEDARAEIETLRSELAIVEATKLDNGVQNTEESRPNGLPLKTLPGSDRLHQQLHEQRSSTGSKVEPAGHSLRPKELEVENSKLREELDATTEKVELQRQLLEELQTALNEQQAEMEQLRSRTDRDPLNLSQERRSSRHEVAEKREEIVGLKHIVQQLSQENAALSSQYKVVESERNLLVSETSQLREELKILEENLEKNLLEEESRLTDETNSLSTQIGDSNRRNSSVSSSEGGEIAELRRKISDMEQKHARVVHDLNREISELETLVESKIYREDELERELERYKEKAARATKKLSKNSNEGRGSSRNSGASSITSNKLSTVDACEICEQPGHDIFTCPILKDEKMQAPPAPAQAAAQWCEDCENYGHSAADCPHSLDVF